ncbi:MAG: GxxExxY protein [Chlamydiales bacterium]|jgi:GxxExxY protein
MTFHLQNRLSDETETLIRSIIGVAIEVHRELGPGYLEKIYEKAMSIELGIRNIPYKTQQFPVKF